MPPVSSVRFGTDGWRAVIGEDFTFKNVRLVAQATADFFQRQQTHTTKKLIVIGFDRRFLSNEFAEATGEIYMSSLIHLGLVLVCITGIVSFTGRWIIKRL